MSGKTHNGGADSAPRDEAALRKRSAVVYWVVSPMACLRHGITERPGAWPAGTVVTALCGDRVKIPWGTPFGCGSPQTMSVTEQCPGCVAEYECRGCPSTVWDF